MRDESTPRFIQGVYEFDGHGLAELIALDGAEYTVTSGAVAQVLYFRAGNSTDELIYVALCRDGVAIRMFPIGARSSVHVSLRVVEDVLGDTILSLQVGAPKDCSGTVVLDLGLVEI